MCRNIRQKQRDLKSVLEKSKKKQNPQRNNERERCGLNRELLRLSKNERQSRRKEEQERKGEAEEEEREVKNQREKE